MTCYHPLKAFRSLAEKTRTGKAVICFARPRGPSEALELPCGQCIGCRLDRSRQWALRCVHEASLHPENCFVTLTYDDANLPGSGSLVKEDHQKFVKRLRERFPSRKVRYFLCGEYGRSGDRPHYHALLFNLDFCDKVPWCESKGNQVYRSPELESLWPFGFSWIGEVTWQSAAYVARYVLKKVNGDRAWEKYVKDVDPDTGECRYLEPEYIAMSRRPGIAGAWYRQFKGDTLKDFLTHEGRKYKLPRFYDKILEVEDVDEYVRRKRKRKEVAIQNKVSADRLAVMETVQRLAAKRLERSI